MVKMGDMHIVMYSSSAANVSQDLHEAAGKCGSLTYLLYHLPETWEISYTSEPYLQITDTYTDHEMCAGMVPGETSSSFCRTCIAGGGCMSCPQGQRKRWRKGGEVHGTLILFTWETGADGLGRTRQPTIRWSSNHARMQGRKTNINIYINLCPQQNKRGVSGDDSICLSENQFCPLW